jgi:hypothetical protein
MVGAGGDQCAADPGHDPVIIYDGAYEDPPIPGKIRRSLRCKKLDLTWIPTDTPAASLRKNVVSLVEAIGKTLPPVPDQVRGIAGFVTLVGGGRISRDNHVRQGWGLMDPQTFKVKQRWRTVTWSVSWWIDVRPPFLTELKWTLQSLPNDPNPEDVPPLHAPDPAGVIRLQVSNLPIGADPPEEPEEGEPEENTFVPHFMMFQRLYPSIIGWPYLVYAPREGVPPKEMPAPMMTTTSYTCVPAKGQ